MAYNFLPAERDQLYLMPPSLRDWLPDVWVPRTPSVAPYQVIRFTGRLDFGIGAQLQDEDTTGGATGRHAATTQPYRW